MINKLKNAACAVDLSFIPRREGSLRTRSAASAANRMIRSARQLSGGCIGWLLTADKAEKPCVYAFCENGTQASAEDLRWIFAPCAAHEPVSTDRIARAFDGCSRIYSLVRPQAPSDDRPDPPASPEALFAYVAELILALSQARATLCILADGANAEVLIGLPEQIPLRIKAMLSLAFPGTEVAALDGSKECPMPIRCLSEAMPAFFEALMSAASLSGFCGVPGDDEDDYADDFDPLPDPKDVVLNVPVEDTGSDADSGDASPAVDHARMLDELIGLDGVKEQVRRISAYAKMKQDMESRHIPMNPVVLNMEFVGNPGTAKTTVARILAGILHDVGLLSDDTLVEVGRADLIARYEGQTADKVRAVFQKAKGRLLFIDEAYTLLENNEGEFGDEAIGTIVQEMENRRQDTVVIFAGYPDKMQSFFARNPGLRSRVPFRIAFPDYSTDELVRIVSLEADKRGFSVSSDAMDTVRRLCEFGKGRTDAGNGRLCRNIAENAILNYAARVYGNDSGTDGQFVLCAQDFPRPAERAAVRPPIGFCRR